MTDTPQELAARIEALEDGRGNVLKPHLYGKPEWDALKEIAVAQAGELDRYREALPHILETLEYARPLIHTSRGDQPGHPRRVQIEAVIERVKDLAGAVSSGEEA